MLHQRQDSYRYFPYPTPGKTNLSHTWQQKRTLALSLKRLQRGLGQTSVGERYQIWGRYGWNTLANSPFQISSILGK